MRWGRGDFWGEVLRWVELRGDGAPFLRSFTTARLLTEDVLKLGARAIGGQAPSVFIVQPERLGEVPALGDRLCNLRSTRKGTNDFPSFHELLVVADGKEAAARVAEAAWPLVNYMVAARELPQVERDASWSASRDELWARAWALCSQSLLFVVNEELRKTARSVAIQKGVDEHLLHDRLEKEFLAIVAERLKNDDPRKGKLRAYVRAAIRNRALDLAGKLDALGTGWKRGPFRDGMSEVRPPSLGASTRRRYAKDGDFGGDAEQRYQAAVLAQRHRDPTGKTVTCRQLSERFECSPRTISDIAKGISKKTGRPLPRSEHSRQSYAFDIEWVRLIAIEKKRRGRTKTVDDYPIEENEIQQLFQEAGELGKGEF